MKKELSCSIVQDLLPNYIEKLTSDETNQAVEEHLDTCTECKEVYDQMVVDVGETEKIPTIELKFLKKVKRTRLFAAALCVILTLVFSYMLYDREFHYSIDKADLSSAITEMQSGVNAYVLETKEVDGVLFASFKGQANRRINGVAKFLKGMNQKYRIVHTQLETSEHSSVVQMFPVEVNDKQYTAVSGYNLSSEIRSYGLDFAAYTSPGYLSDHMVRESVIFDVPNQQFLEIYETEELERLAVESTSHKRYNYHLSSTSLYDADGTEITDRFKVTQDPDVRPTAGTTWKVELFMLYVYIAIVLGLGIIMTRYFLTE